jgi:hypothetical protein
MQAHRDRPVSPVPLHIERCPHVVVAFRMCTRETKLYTQPRGSGHNTEGGANTAGSELFGIARIAIVWAS